jgi:hypothetical protein
MELSGKREKMRLDEEFGQEADHVELDKVPELNEACQQNDRDKDNDRGINELLVFFEAARFGIGIPWPTGFAKFSFDLANKVRNFGEIFDQYDEQNQKDRINDSGGDPTVVDLDVFEKFHSL